MSHRLHRSPIFLKLQKVQTIYAIYYLASISFEFNFSVFASEGAKCDVTNMSFKTLTVISVYNSDKNIICELNEILIHRVA